MEERTCIHDRTESQECADCDAMDHNMPMRDTESKSAELERASAQEMIKHLEANIEAAMQLLTNLPRPMSQPIIAALIRRP